MLKAGDIVRIKRLSSSRWNGHPMKTKLFGVILRGETYYCDVLWLNAETLIEPEAACEDLEVLNESR